MPLTQVPASMIAGLPTMQTADIADNAITTANGTDTFDAGSVSVMYEGQ